MRHSGGRQGSRANIQELTTTRAAVTVLAGGVLLGTAGTAGALAPDHASTTALGALRLVVGAIGLLIAVPLLGGSWCGAIRTCTRWPVWIMGGCSAAYQPLFFEAIHRTGVGTSTLIAVGAAPIFAGLLAWAVLRQRPTRTWLLATLIAALGLLLRSWNNIGLDDLLGLLMATTAALSVGCYVVAAKAELNRASHPVELPAAAYTIGALALLPLLLTQPLDWLATPRGITVALYLGIATMAVGNILAIQGMQRLHAGPAATLLLTDPLTATILGATLLGEQIEPIAVLGLLLVLFGLVLQVRTLDPTKPTRPSDNPTDNDGPANTSTSAFRSLETTTQQQGPWRGLSLTVGPGGLRCSGEDAGEVGESAGDEGVPGPGGSSFAGQ